VFAHRVGMDTIEVAEGLISHGLRLKVAAGNEQERTLANQTVRLNERRGCVLDLLAFWTAWRLGALDAVQLTCGPIQMPQSVLDRLRSRREQFEESARDGLRSAAYENGRMTVREVSGDVITGLRDEVDRAISWSYCSSQPCNELPPSHFRPPDRGKPIAIRDALEPAVMAAYGPTRTSPPSFDWSGTGGQADERTTHRRRR
jgi:cellulose synthase operon protein C